MDFGQKIQEKVSRVVILSGCVSRRATKHWRRIRNGRGALAIASGCSLARFLADEIFGRNRSFSKMKGKRGKSLLKFGGEELRLRESVVF